MEERTDGVNREETARMLHEVAERSSRILKEFGQKNLEQSIASVVKDELGIAKRVHGPVLARAHGPERLRRGVDQLLDRFHAPVAVGLDEDARAGPVPVAEPAKGDNRFKDDDWSGNFVFDYIKQSYLIAARHIQHAVAERRGPARGLAEEGRFLHAPVRRRAVAVEFCAHQPAGAARDHGLGRPEPAQAA